MRLTHGGGDGLPKALDFVPRSAAHLPDIRLAGERVWLEAGGAFPPSCLDATIGRRQRGRA